MILSTYDPNGQASCPTRNSAFGNHSADDRPSVEILKEGSGGLIVR
jgi:hypothetical protein